MADLISMLAAAAGAAAGGGEVDPNFNQTVLLLHGDGTNGAQNNTFLDSSTNNFTITRNGNTTQGTFSPFSAPDGRWSNYFQPSNYIATTTTQIIPATADFTVDGWIYITSTADLSIIARQGTTGTTGRFQIYFNNTNSKIEVSLTSAVYSSTGTISINEWVYVAVTRTGSDLKIYINGSLDSSHTASGAIQNTTFMVGQNWGGEDFYGYASNIRVSDSIRTISGNPTAPFTDDANTILLTCQSNRFVDNATPANTISVTGTPKVTPFSPFAPTAAYDPAVNGGSGYFDGSGDYLSIADSTAFNMGSGDFTSECWIYTTNAAATSAYITTADTTDFQGFFLGQDGGSFFLLADSGSSPWNVSISGGTVVANTWTHVAGVRNGNVFTLYVNGTSVGTTTQSITLGNTNNKIVVGGRTVGSQYFAGYLSNARVVKGTAVYTSGFTPSTSPLTAISGTSLLCNFTNAGIFDNTGKNNLETVGNAQIDTTTKKYGTGSMEFDGTGDYLLLKDNENFIFGTGDFTIEFWVYSGELTTSTIDPNFIDFRPASTNGVYPSIFYDASASNLVFYVSTASRINGGALSENTWYHIAVARSGTSTKMFVDGTQVGSTYTDTNDYLCGTNRPVIGAQGYDPTNVDRQLNGFIDDFRITKGVARYTTTFTPPTKAFPDL